MKIKLNSTIGIDLERLIESRLLVQANSGGGKSWAIRRIIEQAFGHVQIIVLDPEGEFGNLRGAYDFVYVGKDGDALTDTRSATLLARRLLELKASAIVDLYELQPQERKHFVRLFCEALVNAPKELWHDTLIIIDEAHVFAPEKGESEAMGAVIDLATRGRKRGYCVVLATQRLPKLNKDASAECNNKLIGRASQDIDRKRAAEELGFATKEQILSLRDLTPGEFYLFGPAISREVIKIQIGDVEVKPARRGVSKSTPPPPTEKVKKILAQLADLPQEARKELTTISELKAEIARLKRDQKPSTSAPMGVSQWLEYGKKYGYQNYFQEKIIKEKDAELFQWQTEWQKQIQNWFKILKSIGEGMQGYEMKLKKPIVKSLSIDLKPIVNKPIARLGSIEPKDYQTPVVSALNKGEREILTAIAQYEEATMEHIAVLTGYKSTSRREYLRKLIAAGYVSQHGELYRPTESGIEVLGDFTPLPTGQELRNHLMQTLPEGERKVLSAILGGSEDMREAVPKEYIQEETMYKNTSTREYLRKLAARKVIERVGKSWKASDKLF